MVEKRGKTVPVLLIALVLTAALATVRSSADVVTPVPQDQRGRLDAERLGHHDANNMRTRFWNYGMVGDYPENPGNVDLSVFHSVEVPKGSGMNYSDGVTPFVLAKITQINGVDAYIMETGFRERQGTSPFFNRVMRFEPRPGFFQDDAVINAGRSPAISNDPRTWPDFWPDRLDDITDPGWSGSWNGFFGKQIVADQESYMVMDDDFYDAWQFYPDSRDPTRRGLGLRIEQRGFQWANPQARNVIFWLYDITNEGTTDYDDNIVFGLYMDSGVGGSALSCDGIFESDDDNAFYNREFDEEVINLVYTWDNGGHGRNLNSSCAQTGYLGYAYMETPGNSIDGIDNDEDGITDELRAGGPGIPVIGQDQILAYVSANYNLERFEITHGPVIEKPAYLKGLWWTGDEDLDWTTEGQDLGVDGVPDTNDEGEGDGIPTDGEPNFDSTDLHESDQIGLTGFKINRIVPGQGNPNQETDGIVFFTDNKDWPERLYDQFTDPVPEARFDDPLASNYNIGFLFASGPFTLKAGQTERFSLALAYGADLTELRSTVRTVQTIYDANYRFAVPPRLPTATAQTGDGFVRLSWDDVAEHGLDAVTGEEDFQGYRIYRSTDPEFRDPKVISTGTGSGPIGNGKPIAQFDVIDGISGFSEDVVEGVAYFLGTDSGITHTWTDFSVTNGQQYYYAVTAYDSGSENFGFYPSENAITASRTLRGGLILPTNVVAVRPNPKALGFMPANADSAVQIANRGAGRVLVDVVNSEIVPDAHVFKVSFTTPAADSLRATAYSLTDSTTGEILFETGADFNGQGIGPVGAGLLPIIITSENVSADTTGTGFLSGSPTDARLQVNYLDGLPANYIRPGYPDDITIFFYDTEVGSSLHMDDVEFPARPAKFEIIAHTASGDQKLDFRFRDIDGDGTISQRFEVVDAATYAPGQPDEPWFTWRFELESPVVVPGSPPGAADAFALTLTRPFGADDYFVFDTRAEYLGTVASADDFQPYVVPNPYVGSASFEPDRFAVSGRGERRIEFRGLPSRCTIRIFNVNGELVQTLNHDGSNDGYVSWDLRTKDNIDVAPGLYIFHVEGGQAGTRIGKFAIIK